MANFLQQPRQFNPYIQQLPIDTYAAVATQKQMEYNAGVQKVGSYQSALAGLNVVRDTDRKYLDDRVSNLTSRINEAASADWSSQALVGQVGTLAGMIYNDANIRSAVAGTQKYLKDEQDITEAKKNGKWSPENEWFLRRQMSKWLNEPTVGASYQTDGFKPYEDVGAAVIKAWDNIKPDSRLVQKPSGEFYAYQTVESQVTGKDGRTLTETAIKELPPDQVSAQISALLTPSQREQLGISGLYHFRGNNDADSLNKLVEAHFSKSEQYYDSLLATEKLNQTLQASNTAAQGAITARIADIEKKKTELSDNKKEYKQTAASNPDALKSSIYYEDWLNGISGMIGYSEASTKILDNPAYKAQLEEWKIWAQMRRSLSGKKGKGDGEDDETGPWEPETALVLPLTEQQRKQVSLEDFKSKLLALQSKRDQDSYGLLYRHFGDRYVNHLFKDINGDGVSEEIFTLKPGMEKEATLTMGAWWDSYRKGDPDLDITVRETFADIDEKKLLMAKLADVTGNIEKSADDAVKGMADYGRAKSALQTYERMPSAVIAGTQIAPADVRKYIKLRDENLVSGSSPGVGAPGIVYLPDMTDQQLSHYGLDRSRFNALKSADKGDGSKSEVKSFSVMLGALRPVLSLTEKVEAARNQYIGEQVRKYQGIFNEVAITVPSYKAELMRPVANFVQTLAAGARQTGMGGSTDWPAVREMIGEKHAAQTTYGYVQDRDGNVRIRISNVDVDKGNPQEIVVDSRSAQVSGLYTPDPLAVTRSLLDLGEGIRTGATFEGSVPLTNGRTGRYQVRHEVENFGGRYKVKLYVNDTQDKASGTRQIPVNTTLFADWNQLTRFLQTDVTERFISSMLSAGNPATGAPAGSYGDSSFLNRLAPPGLPPEP